MLTHPDTFVMKIEGVHIWEAPVSKLNSYLLVSPCSPPDLVALRWGSTE